MASSHWSHAKTPPQWSQWSENETKYPPAAVLHERVRPGDETGSAADLVLLLKPSK